MRDLIAVCKDVKILREEEEWLVAEKPAPLIVHPTNDRPEPTLVSELAAIYRGRGEEVPPLMLANRLDRETSGCVLVAKTRRAAGVFGKALMRREVRKFYRAIVSGWPEVDNFDCDGPLIRKGEVAESAIWVRQVVHESGKESVTKFRVERRTVFEGRKVSLVHAEPLTGRTHQIRAHLEHLGFPILGDKIYSGDGSEYLEFIETGWTENLAERLVLARQALHAYFIEVWWEGFPCHVESPLPKEFRKILGIEWPSDKDK